MKDGSISSLTTELQSANVAYDVYDFRFSNDGKYVAVGKRDDIFVFDLRERKLIHKNHMAERVNHQEPFIRSFEFSPDSKLLLWPHQMEGNLVTNTLELPAVKLKALPVESGSRIIFIADRKFSTTDGTFEF